MESPAVGVSQPLYPSAPLSPDYEVPDIILTIPSGVVLYYINKDGNVVTTLPSPTFLQVPPGPYFLWGPGGSLEQNCTFALWAVNPMAAVRLVEGWLPAGHKW